LPFWPLVEIDPNDELLARSRSLFETLSGGDEISSNAAPGLDRGPLPSR
jgi:hypothetical protein